MNEFVSLLSWKRFSLLFFFIAKTLVLVVIVGLRWYKGSLCFDFTEDCLNLFYVLGFNLLVISVIIKHLKSNFPKIRMVKDSIFIGERKIGIDEIESIVVRSKHKVNLLFKLYDFESSVVKLKNGGEVIIYIGGYANGNVLRMNLDGIQKHLAGIVGVFEVIEKTEDIVFDNLCIDETIAIRFNHSFVKSLHNVLAILATLFFCLLTFLLIKHQAYTEMFFALLLIFLLAWTLVKRNYYFLLVGNVLVVKNLFIPNRRIVFPLSEVICLDIEGIRNASLILVDKQFNVYTYRSEMNDSVLLGRLIEEAEICKKNK